MSSLKPTKNGKEYWRSLGELARTPEFERFLHKEFPSEVLGGAGSMNRRRFLQLMGASLALAGVAGCNQKQEKILPYSRRPWDQTPGVPKHFTTAMELGGVAAGLTVTSYDNRPVKVDGNPKHPFSQGAADVFAQGSLLGLYDPDRAQNVVEFNNGMEYPRTWAEFATAMSPILAGEKTQGGAGIRFLSEASSSPSTESLRQALAAGYPQAKWYEFEPISADNERDGGILAFGAPYRTHLALDTAKVVVALDADLFGSHPAKIRYTKDFTKGRKPESGTMSRLYAVEGRHSLTGAMADHRLALRPSQVLPFALALERALAAHPLLAGQSLPMAGWKAPEGGFLAGVKVQKYLIALANDLAKNAGTSAVSAGASQPASVHAAVHRINALLGNAGKTVLYTQDPDPGRLSHGEAIKTLTQEMLDGKVQALFILGGNPVYTAPADVPFSEALTAVKTSVHFSVSKDETSLGCTWHTPQAHYLESWSDARAYDGTVTLVQPLIAPLYDGKTTAEFLALLHNDPIQNGYDIVRRTFAGGALVDEKAWRKALKDGFVEVTASTPVTPALKSFDITFDPETLQPFPGPSRGFELQFIADSKLYDGRFSNNGWLQELPDFLTKITWDNAVLIDVKSAVALGVDTGSMVSLSYQGRTVEAPAYLMPGQAEGTLVVALGYGRKQAGHIGGYYHDGVQPIGFDFFGLRTSEALEFGKGARLQKTGRTYKLACTQEHHVIDNDEVGREGIEERLGQLIREAGFEHYEKHPDFAKHVVHHPPLEQLWQEFEYNGSRWGMAIDLSTCTGCNACVMACNAENNVPIVGKELVLQGREMQWIRLDRYFKGAPEEAEVAHQPLTCQQCENAPCESVCPVAATVHSSEGLNDMVYNRCVGTRYCSNNCPYKVRRFNYFNFHLDVEQPKNEVLKMAFNPEVTVRGRGVMEKCTFCTQRISAARITAKNERRPIADGEIVPACAQTCPADAITFGDLNTPNSLVAQAQAEKRSYFLLEEINTRPRLAYLAKVRNPNPELV